MQEVQQVRRRRAQSLDPALIEPADGLDDGCLGGAAKTRIKKAAEGRLVLSIFVDVRNPELRFPKEGVIGPFENLALLGDGAYHYRGGSICSLFNASILSCSSFRMSIIRVSLLFA